MKVLAIALALCFGSASVEAAVTKPVTKIHRAAKPKKFKAKSNAKRVVKASKIKKLNRSRAKAN